MRIFTWCDPNYFHFMSALIKSIRYHENDNKITALLMDFSPSQKNAVKEFFKNDSRLEFIWDNGKNFKNFPIEDKIQYYRNCRPRYFIDVLKKSEDGKLCTFGANGIVWTKLDYIENFLDENDFVFLERKKPNRFSTHPETVGSMEELNKFMNDTGLTFPEIFPTSTSKIVLLGTHAMRRNENTLKVLGRWKDLVENPKDLNTHYSDMNLFVQAYIDIQNEIGWKMKKETGLSLTREENPFCDTNFNTDKIWFAKGMTKYSNKKYHEAVEFFLNYEYTI